MRVVDRPAFRPQHCAAIPFIGPASHPDVRWVDTGAEMPGFDNHVFLSDVAVEQAALALGYPTPAAYEALQAELVETLKAWQTAQEELVGLKTYKAAVDAIRNTA